MPRRWSDLDTDAHRLPSGFTRAGYDSNTRRYHFSDAEGRMYQGEPGEEFGGRLIPMNVNDPSMMHRFAPDDNEVEDKEEYAVDSPPNSSEAGNPRLVFSTPAGQATQPVPRIVPSFSDFLSSNQMAAATSPKLPQQKQLNRGPTFSLKRVTTSIMGFRSTKSKKSATLPILPSPEVDEWGAVQSPRSAKF